MEATPESGLPPRLEGVYTPTVHADAPGRGERLRGPALLLFTLTAEFLKFAQITSKFSILDTVSEY